MKNPNLLIATADTVRAARLLMDEAAHSYRSGDKLRFRRQAFTASQSQDFPAVATYLAHEADPDITSRFGSWRGYIAELLSMAKNSVDETRRAGRALRLLDGQTADNFTLYVDQLDVPHRVEVLAILAGAAARAEGGRQILDFASPPEPVYAPWHVQPLKIPKWRRDLMIFGSTDFARQKEYDDLCRGAFVLAPDPHAREDDSYPAWALCESEAQRLKRAKLYFIDDDLCAAASRKAQRPVRTPVTAHRVLPGAGFMVLATPHPFAEGCPPIVAVSFSVFDPAEHGPWITTNSPQSQEAGEGVAVTRMRFEAAQRWWWITFYAQEPAQTYRSLPMCAYSETVVGEGHQFEGEPQEGTNEHITRFVFALFSLITQADLPTPKPVTRTTELARKGAERRSDRRRGIEDDGRVRIVTVGRPTSPTGRRAGPSGGSVRGPLAYRQLVTEHDKAQCQNTHRHAELGDACVHEDITVIEYERGPADAPFRLSNTVYRPTNKDAHV
ncbi:hypothetical protein [Streptomyces sp. NPDC057302]|uniref:hypothetical protein n=1 Tax=Streptomyces sp. NPDC057302 TaxID=3346094 RepID=UPI00363C6B9F